MYKNLRSKCFIKDLWCSPKILTRCIAKQLYGEKKRREYNCRKSVGTRAGLRDSRYSRTANTVHCTGEERNTERQILGGTTCTIHWHQHWQGGANVQSLDFKLLLGGGWGVLALVGWGASGVGRVSRERDSWRFGDRQRKRSWQEAQTLFSSSMLFFSLWPHHLPNHCLSPSPISHLVTQSNTSWSLHLPWSWSSPFRSWARMNAEHSCSLQQGFNTSCYSLFVLIRLPVCCLFPSPPCRRLTASARTRYVLANVEPAPTCHMDHLPLLLPPMARMMMTLMKIMFTIASPGPLLNKHCEYLIFPWSEGMPVILPGSSSSSSWWLLSHL